MQLPSYSTLLGHFITSSLGSRISRFCLDGAASSISQLSYLFSLTGSWRSRRTCKYFDLLSWIAPLTNLQSLYFSGQSRLFVYTRPYEALFRDPWWIFTVLSLFYNIKTRYEFGYIELMRVSPRFALLLATMLIGIAFIIVDVLAVTHVIKGSGLPDGINPFWKMAFAFKCFTDTIILDDFKTALDRLKQFKLQRIGSVPSDGLRGEFSDFSDPAQARRKKDEQKLDVLDISNPSEFVHENAGQHMARDWTKPQANGASETMDLEAALREVVPEGNSSKSKSSYG